MIATDKGERDGRRDRRREEAAVVRADGAPPRVTDAYTHDDRTSRTRRRDETGRAGVPRCFSRHAPAAANPRITYIYTDAHTYTRTHTHQQMHTHTYARARTHTRCAKNERTYARTHARTASCCPPAAATTMTEAGRRAEGREGARTERHTRTIRTLRCRADVSHGHARILGVQFGTQP